MRQLDFEIDCTRLGISDLNCSLSGFMTLSTQDF